MNTPFYSIENMKVMLNIFKEYMSEKFNLDAYLFCVTTLSQDDGGGY